MFIHFLGTRKKFQLFGILSCTFVDLFTVHRILRAVVFNLFTDGVFSTPKTDDKHKCNYLIHTTEYDFGSEVASLWGGVFNLPHPLLGSFLVLQIFLIQLYNHTDIYKYTYSLLPPLNTLQIRPSLDGIRSMQTYNIFSGFYIEYRTIYSMIY